MKHGEGHFRWREASPIVKILIIVAGIAAMGGFLVLAGFVLLWLWNWLMPMLFRLPTITFWESWGILLLSTILFNRPRSFRQGMHDLRRRKHALRDRLKEAELHRDDEPGGEPQEA